MASNEFGDVARRLGDVERVLAGSGAGEPRVLDRDELARLPGAIEMYRAALALIAGDPAGTLSHAHRVLGLVAEDDHLIRSAASALGGLASWTTGDLTAAHRGYSAAAAGLERVGHVSDVLGCTITLADIEIIQGRLRQARRTYEQARRLADDHGPGLRGTRDMHVGLSQIAYEQDDLVAAAEHLRRSEALDEQAGLPQNPYRWRVALALLREAEGDRESALDLLAEAERVYVGDFSPDVRPVAALRARMLAAHGDLPAALDWARRTRPAPGRRRAVPPRVRISDPGPDHARRRFTGGAARRRRPAGAAPDRGGRGRRADRHADRDPGRPRATPAGPPATAPRHAHAGATPRALAEPEGLCPGLTAEARTGRVRPRRAPRDGLVDPLSDRELDVMRLLAGDLDGPSIARHLVVSLNTVRTHTKHIYAKLGVTNRRAAVRRAHELNLLSRTFTT